jgi:hypothetical protein
MALASGTRLGTYEMDFGLAKRAPASPTALTFTLDALSERGLVAGTVSYMAPEQIRAENVDARSDLFAFGILLYELLTGRRPFTGSSAIVVSVAILSQSPEPLASLRSDLPDQLLRIVAQCLEKNPLERPQSALDVANELRRLRLSSRASPLRAGEPRRHDEGRRVLRAGARARSRVCAGLGVPGHDVLARGGSGLDIGGGQLCASAGGGGASADARARPRGKGMRRGAGFRGFTSGTGGVPKLPMPGRWSWLREMPRWSPRPASWRGASAASRMRLRCAALRWSRIH